jgi:hypothetical protein
MVGQAVSACGYAYQGKRPRAGTAQCVPLILMPIDIDTHTPEA